MSSADLMSAGSWRLSVYGKTAEAKPVIEVADVQAIRVPTSGGESVIFSDSSSKFELETDYDAIIAALTFRPHDGLHYRFKLGQVRGYELSYSSGAQTNTLEGYNDGFLWGAGVRWNITQDTPVSAGIALDVAYSQTNVKLDRFESGGAVTAIDHRVVEDEVQAAVNVSKRFKWFEPYGGLRLGWLRTQWKDLEAKGKLSGETEVVTPFLGVQLEVFPGEHIVVEASFVDEKSISAGFNITF